MMTDKSLENRNAQQGLLLQAKLHPPVYSRRLIERPLLKEWIQAAEHARLVLVRAPAGYGKTTLMAQWYRSLQEQGTKAAWLSLDESDSDPDRFRSYLFAAIQQAMPDKQLTAFGRSSWGGEGALVAGGLYLLDLLAEAGGRFTIFLDDFGKIQNPLILQMIRQLLSHLPQGKNIVMGTRRLPDIGLGRVRARGELVDIDVECLRFSFEQTAQFVRQVQKKDLDDEALNKLYSLTEGWVAGMQLFTLSDQWLESIGRRAAISAGSLRQLTEYLAEDVLNHQPEEIQNFLLQTSILNRFSSSLCDALTGRNDSNQMLDYLEKANLFLVPLDEEYCWYRYFSLFAKFLNKRLEQQYGERVAELHLVASRWYEQQGEYQEAAMQALAAGRKDRAAGLMDQCVVDLLRTGMLGDILTVVEQLPDEVLDLYPKLLVAYVYTLTLRRHYEDAAEVVGRVRPEMDIYPGFHNDVRLVKAIILFAQDRISACKALVSERFLEDCEEKKPVAYSTLLSLVGSLKVIGGRYDESLEYFGRAHLAAQRVSDHQAAIFNKYYEVTRELFLGRLQAAAVLCRDTLQSVETGPLRYSLGSAALAVVLAHILYETDEIEKADGLLAKYNTFLRLLIPADVFIIGFRTLCWLHVAKGNFPGALSCLAEFERLGAELGLPRVVATARLELVRLALLRGDQSRATTLFHGCAEKKVWQDFEGMGMIGNDPGTLELNRIRLMIELGKGEQALDLLKDALPIAENQRRFRQSLLIRILMARAYHCCREEGRAQRALRKALFFAQDEGYIRIFVDEGETVGTLISEIARSTSVGGDALSSEYLDRLVKAMATAGYTGSDTGPAGTGGLIEALTEREINILELVALGLSNEDLGNKLYISKHTVRSHMRNINSKLGAKNRTEAVALARRYGLIK